MTTRDPQKLHDKAHRYYWKHRDREIARRAEYREAHKAELLAYDRKYREEHREQIRERDKKKNRGPRPRQGRFLVKDLFPGLHWRRQRNTFLKCMYGISLIEVEEMLEKQEGKCGICQKPFTEEMRPCVDHQKDGPVRALLCNHCNLVIGHAAEKPDLLRGAARYIEELGSEHEMPKTCQHGVSEGWNCWQCGGRAVIK